MSAKDIIRALSADATTTGLLADCRFEGFGTMAYGPDAIGALFRRHSFVVDPVPHVVECTGGIALFAVQDDAARVAFVADTVGGNIARLWRLGPIDRPEPVEAAIDVPFDTDMHQIASPVVFAASDHIWLAADAAPHVVAVGTTLAAAAGRSRSRALCLRAFSAGATGAALFRCYAPSDDDPRIVRAVYAAADFRWAGGRLVQSRLVVDDERDAGEWTPRF